MRRPTASSSSMPSWVPCRTAEPFHRPQNAKAVDSLMRRSGAFAFCRLCSSVRRKRKIQPRRHSTRTASFQGDIFRTVSHPCTDFQSTLHSQSADASLTICPSTYTRPRQPRRRHFLFAYCFWSHFRRLLCEGGGQALVEIEILYEKDLDNLGNSKLWVGGKMPKPQWLQGVEAV